MATGESYSYFARSSHHDHFLSSQNSSSDHVFDFDESDIWNASVAISSSPDEGGFHKPVASSWGKKKKSAASSLPMDVPDWSKILRGDYRESRHEFELVDGDSEEEEEEEVRFPPHEFLAKQRSRHGMWVHEGILKGRDLSRVRNAIWKQTGFED